MQPCVLPPTLKPGSRLVAIAPSGAVRDPVAFQRGLDLWRSRGYEVTLAPGWDEGYGYLAGTDAGRRNQLTTALNDPNCDGILCIRGGWGAARLLENWQMPIDINSPKWLVGFSDITSLLWGLACEGISSVHGPVLSTLGDEPQSSHDRLFNWLENHEIDSLQGTGWDTGSTAGPATGLLLPANLTVATHLLNTPYQPDLDGIILALEDVGEAPYRLDRMLTHWRMTGALDKVRGIALGRFSSCEAPEGYPSLTVEEMLRDRLEDLGIPIVADLPFGHEGENAALPVGVMVRLDGSTGTLDFIGEG
ncbi:MAG: LD-carboxypeptidase [Cyanobacteria bacterium]|nr:LD-carboxypeptidase [Cyanobacteriota bacterium]